MTACGELQTDRLGGRVQQGTLEVSSADLNTGVLYALQGDWRIHFEDRAEFARRNYDDSSWELMPVVGHWHMRGTVHDGAAWYRLHVRMPNRVAHNAGDNQESRRSIPQLAVQFPFIDAASVVYWNGERLGSLGEIDAEGKAREPAINYVYYRIPSELIQKENVLAIRVASVYGMGGISKPDLFLGELETVRSFFHVNLIEDSLLSFMTLALSLYHLLLYFLRRNDRFHLYFVLFCINATLFQLSWNPVATQVGIGFYWNLLFIQSAIVLNGIFSYLVITYFFDIPARRSRTILGIISGGLYLFLLLALLFPKALLLPYMMFGMPAGFVFNAVGAGFVLYACVYSLRRKKPQSVLFTIGLAVLLSAIALDMFSYSFSLGFPTLTSYAYMFLILTISAAIAIRNSRSFQTAEDLSQRLEEKVAARTQQLQVAQTQTEQARQEIQTLAEFSRRIASQTDLQAVVREVAQYTVESMGMNRAFLLLVDTERQILKGSDGYSRSVTAEQAQFVQDVNIPLSVDLGTLYKTYQRRKTLHLPDLSRFPLNKMAPLDRKLVEIFELSAFIQIPLLANDEVCGILAIDPAGTGVTRSTLKSLEAFANQIAGAVQTARILEERDRERELAQRLQRETEGLNNLLKNIAPLKDIEAIMERVIEYVSETYDIHHYSLYNVDHDAGKIYFVAANLPEHISEENRELIRSTPIDITHPTGAFALAYRRNNRSVYFPRIRKNISEPQEKFVIEQYGMSNFLINPLSINNRVFAFLNFTRYKPEGLKRQQIQQLSILSDAIAGIIQTIHLLDDVEKAQRASDELLNNILPASIANELKAEGQVEPMWYDSVSVLFTDFVGFTRASTKMLPDELISELDGCFSQFDEVIKHNHMEKLKTIGDAYMCAAGLPAISTTHAIDACLTALELRAFMLQMAEVKQALGYAYWRIRIGIHSGPVTAGVIGKNKFAYDIWGDTVNTASRMESGGEPDRINISETTYELVKEFFECEYRGKINAKGKGE
ncbi:MAG: GAF domain-containing protein, partial [Leptospiraceae bacterium]|nr:GAF domain-containing protein [Leptospiraceae bacterium]